MGGVPLPNRDTPRAKDASAAETPVRADRWRIPHIVKFIPSDASFGSHNKSNSWDRFAFCNAGSRPPPTLLRGRASFPHEVRR
jgi:hypothetical protein